MPAMYVACRIPGTASILCRYALGNGCTWLTRLTTYKRLALDPVPKAFSQALTPCSRPKSRKAIMMDSSVKIVRAFLRHKLVQIKGKNFMPPNSNRFRLGDPYRDAAVASRAPPPSDRA